MNILYIGYWGFNEGLTQSTIIPHLKILSEMDSVEKLIYCSIERSGQTDFDINLSKVSHFPLYSKPSKIPLWDKVNDFIDFPRTLLQYCEEFDIDKIIARGAPAGALAYLVWKNNKLPYCVESYEPHADYMLESGVWGRFDPRYLFQKHWEKKQKSTATALMPVSENYKIQLLKEGVDEESIDVIPCVVDVEKFAFDPSEREKIRTALGIGDGTMTGVYVGKFGGIYLDESAFDIFDVVARQYEKFHLIILSPDSSSVINQKANGRSFTGITILSVDHSEVPSYLSASNIAFATIKPAESRKYCSAIKIGEYWANGLPVIITPGVGDDSEIIQKENAGMVVDPDHLPEKMNLNFKSRTEIQKLALNYRSIEISKKVYQKWYGENN